MKILLLNFLRLGDIIMMAPLINDLKRKYPKAQIHFMGFSEFSIVKDALKRVDQWHFVSRSLIQETSSHSESGLLDAPDLLLTQFDRLNSVGFDLAVNLSHTKFSALAMSLIESKEKWGTYFEGDTVHYSSDIFEKMDSDGFQSQIHLLDWYRKGFQLDEGPVNWKLSEESLVSTQKPSLSSGRKLYLFQTLSSDAKKAWSKESWVRLFSEIRRLDPFAELKMICAPFEASQLKSLSQETGVELVPCGLSQAHQLIQKADVFVTLDTSTKHLANDSTAKVVELCLGSADFSKQGIYKAGSIVLAPQINCYPCNHSDHCPLLKRDCASEIEVSDILWALGLRKQSPQEVKCRVFQTITHKEWSIMPMTSSKGEIQIESKKGIAEEHPEA